jgi:hypothetical protein
MSIASKHRYRFVFLRSEKWKAVRLQALANQKAQCRLCGYESIANDAHHLYYPASVWDTDPSDLVILCRPCHELIHRILIIQNNRKTRKSSALADLKQIAAAISEWKDDCELWKGEARKLNKKPALRKQPKGCGICLSRTKPLHILDVGKRISRKKHRPALFFVCEQCDALFHKQFPVKGSWKDMHDWVYSVRLQKKLLDCHEACDYPSVNDDSKFDPPSSHPESPSVG